MATFISHTEGLLIEGSAVTYSCSPGLKVIESNKSTCMDNGQWEPDPLDVTCAGNNYYSLCYYMYLECSAHCDTDVYVYAAESLYYGPYIPYLR